MSTDFSIKPVGAPAGMPVAQPVNEAANGAVATDLPASQSVTAADAGAGAQPANDYVSHQMVLDRAAASIVYQVVDDRTGQVVDQYPDEAVLRRRAYFHTLDLAKQQQSPPRPLATDRKA
jgi:hypothetical protein